MEDEVTALLYQTSKFRVILLKRLKVENRNYTVDELTQNTSFCRMVYGTAGTAEIDYWSRWMEESDENRKKAKEAIGRVTGFKLTTIQKGVSEPGFEKEWSRLYKSTIGKYDLNQLSSFTNENGFRWIYRVAAILLLGSMMGLGAWLYLRDDLSNTSSEQAAIRKTVVTTEGQQKTLTFSNGAKIVMNDNSALTYSTGSSVDRTIRVNLTRGGAFFSDKSSAPGKGGKRRTFTVTTPDGLVKDIGTEFVVTVDQNDSRIILQDGHVRIETINGEKSNKGYDMKKGEMVTLKNSRVLKKEIVNPTLYTAWATGFIQFDHTPVHEFARFVEKRFKIKVVITNPSLDNVTMDGAVYFKSLIGLVRSVSVANQVPVYLSGGRDTVYVGNPNNSKNEIKQ